MSVHSGLHEDTLHGPCGMVGGQEVGNSIEGSGDRSYHISKHTINNKSEAMFENGESFTLSFLIPTILSAERLGLSPRLTFPNEQNCIMCKVQNLNRAHKNVHLLTCLF